MNELPLPPYSLWQSVGYDNQIYQVVGFRFRPGYQVFGWEYWISKPEEYGPTENSTFISVRDDQLMTLQALLADRTEKAGKYAAETQRIAKEAQAEHERLMSQSMPRE